MQADWHSFLTQRGAVIEAGTVLRFETAAVRREDATVRLFDLSRYGLLSVRGEDAPDFLQGQLGNDVTRLERGVTHLTSYSTAQGRMLAIMRAFRFDSAIQLLLPGELIDPVQQRLSRYVLRARVELGNDHDRLARIALAGTGSESLLARLGLPAPSAAGEVAADGELCVLNVSAGESRYVLVAPYAKAMTVWQAAEARVSPAGDSDWRLLRIDAGLPSVWPATSEAFVPQMTNLELLGGVDFDKGCYAGQEIVARAQYLGRIKRRMFRFGCAVEVVPPPGETIVGEDGSEVGTVVDAAAADPGCRLLAVVPIAGRDQPLRLARADGPALRPLTLPYTIPMPEERD